ncbi:MAG TPA: aspartate aminotransferase family protein [Phycisphaerae bacterium]|nr:aspartate aminotransferase family protein [Phycisphaerae bacterium]HPS52261.1 aspartate aminotransferase family protein [Phycisphaerae bacterium]
MSEKKFANVKTAIPGPKSAALLQRWHRAEADTTGFQAPVVWDSASGVVITDVDGNSYLDWTSGVLVTNVGHCHPKLVAAVQQAVAKLINSYECPTEARIKAAEALVAHLPKHLDKCFFMTTGSEATESCTRIMKRKTGCFEIIGVHGGFHGRTYAAASAGGLSGPKRGYGPTMPGVIRVPYPYAYRSPVGSEPGKMIDYYMTLLEDEVRANSTGALAGLIVEPYLGAAGFIFPPKGYLTEIEKWCRAKGILFTLDEVQSSYGRTGRMWAMEWENLTPDLVSIGKGIGNGIPTSAVAARGDVIACLGKGEMSSTVGGNPVSSTAVSTILEIMDEEKLVDNSLRMGKFFMDKLLKLQEKSRYIGEVRGRGLIIGVELVKDKKTKEPAADLAKQLICRCAENGLIIGSVGIYGNVIRVAPPLVVNEAQAMESIEIFEKSILSLES